MRGAIAPSAIDQRCRSQPWLSRLKGWGATSCATPSAKDRLRGLTVAMAADHVVEGIRVNAVLLGTTDTSWLE